MLTTILKNGSASTVDVVDGVLGLLPKIEQQLPSSLKITPINDQSLFVKAAISGVMREGVLAASLTSLMILLFLGSWRSTVIIAISIPLAVLSALMALWLTGQTLNIMTQLGGLALAVGILVDDATVTIENINWHLEHGKSVTTAILDGARQIVQPAFVSLLCICIAFVPMFALQGVAGGFLFTPMANERGVRPNRLLYPVAHFGADHGELSAEAARAWRSKAQPQSAGAAAAEFQIRLFQGCARAIATSWP